MRTRQEIQALFDVQIEAITRRIRERLDWLAEKGHREQVVRPIYLALNNS